MSDIALHSGGMAATKDKERLKQYGRRLRMVREALGFETTRAFAEATGVTEDALSSWERGVNRIPDYYLLRLKTDFAVSADYVLFGDPSALSQRLHSELRNRFPTRARDAAA